LDSLLKYKTGLTSRSGYDCDWPSKRSAFYHRAFLWRSEVRTTQRILSKLTIFRFWGDSIYRAGAGPMPVPPKKLNAQTLAEAIETALEPTVKEMAEKIGDDIRAEQGEMKGVESFHKHLPLLNMRYVRDYSSSVRH